MGKSAPSAPAAPDPNVTSAAQTKSNKETALYNFGLNNPNVSSPLGSSTFHSNGVDANGTPIYNQNITLSPDEQRIFDTSQQNIYQQGQTANTALQSVQNQFGTPYDLKGNVQPLPSQQDLQGNLNDTRDALYRQSTQYLDPQFQQSQAQLTSQLANQGIPQGSAAYNTAMDNLSRQKQQAYQSARDSSIAGGTAAQAQYSQTGLANQAQQAQMYNQQYSQPLANYASLMSGTAPTLPQFGAANSSQAAPTNVLGAYQNQYQGQLNQYNAQMGAYNSQMGALGSIGGAGLSALLSDRRLKKNIRRVGELKNSLPVYEYSYIWDDVLRRGVMADEVARVIPEAVLTMPNGYQAVRYDLLGE